MMGGGRNCSTPRCGARGCDSGRADSAPEQPRCTIAHSHRDASGALASSRKVWCRGETECVCQPTQAVPSSTCAPEPACIYTNECNYSSLQLVVITTQKKGFH